MIVAGYRPEQIAIMLHRSLQSVYARGHNLHLSFKRARLKPSLGPEIEIK
jgi:hypothetical protein